MAQFLLPAPALGGGLVHPNAGDRLSSYYLLKLYVTGNSHRAQTAIHNLRAICEQELHGEYKVEIIDVLADPDRAEQDRILATPTLIKQLPPPLRRVIGDLSDRDKVLLGLELRRETDSPSRERPLPPETAL